MKSITFILLFKLVFKYNCEILYCNFATPDKTKCITCESGYYIYKYKIFYLNIIILNFTILLLSEYCCPD